MSVHVSRRTAVAVTGCLALLVGCTAGPGDPAGDNTGSQQPPSSGPVEPVGSQRILDGWRLARTIRVPEHGTMIFADGSLWVGSRPLGVFDEPTGTTYQIDPASGKVLHRFPGVAGEWPAVGAGAIWFNTTSVMPGLVTRLDLTTHDVKLIRTGTGPQSSPFAPYVARDKVWVADFAQRGLAEIDARTGQVLKRSRPRPDLSGLRGWTAGDGHTFFVNVFESGRYTRFDAVTGKPVSVVDTHISAGGGGALVQDGHTLYAAMGQGSPVDEDLATGYVVAIDVGTVGSEKVIHELRLPGPEAVYGADPTRLVLGFGSLWAVRYSPSELIRIDPATLHITGRMPIPGPVPPEGEPPGGPWRDVAVGGGSLWVRSPGLVQQFVPRD